MPEGPDGKTIIIVKKVSGHGGHHGGAWKVAYADFVTAMMALFMVLWLVNSASVTTREKIASFFRRPGVFEKGSGTPLELGGSGILSDAFSPPSEGNASIAPSENPYNVGQSGGEYIEGFGRGEGEQAGDKGEPQEANQGVTLEMIAANIKQNLNDAVLKEGGFGDDYYGQALGNGQMLGDKKADSDDIVTVAGQLIHDNKGEQEAGKEGALAMQLNGAGDKSEGANQPTSVGQGAASSVAPGNPLGEIDVVIDQRGIHIEIMDTEKTSMFEVGNAGIKGDAEKALDKIAQLLIKLPNTLDIEGHTDALPFSPSMSRHYDNWNLSMDRADSARRALIKAGLSEDRIARVVGYAAQKPKEPDPLDPSNRRITITMRYSNEAAALLGGKGKTVNPNPINTIPPTIVEPIIQNKAEVLAAPDANDSSLGIEVGTHLPEGEVIDPETLEAPSTNKDKIFGGSGSLIDGIN